MNIQGELRYRLSHRAALYMGESSEKRREFFDFFRKAYDIRSQIVHGSSSLKLPLKPDGNKYTLVELTENLQEMLREALKKAVRLSASSGSTKRLADWESLMFQDG